PCYRVCSSRPLARRIVYHTAAPSPPKLVSGRRTGVPFTKRSTVSANAATPTIPRPRGPTGQQPSANMAALLASSDIAAPASRADQAARRSTPLWPHAAQPQPRANQHSRRRQAAEGQLDRDPHCCENHHGEQVQACPLSGVSCQGEELTRKNDSHSEHCKIR